MKYLILITLLFSNPAFAQHFNTGSDKPTQELKEELARFYKEKIKDNKVYSLTIEGHTDVRGSKSYNLELSKKRAKAALKELVKLGYDGNYVITKGFGEEQPISNTHGENRRIVLKLETNAGNSVTVIKECKPDVRVIVKKEKSKVRKNRIRLLGGYGTTGVESKKEGKLTSLEEEKGLVLGLSYDRLVTERWSLGGQLQTDKTILMSIGYDF